MLPRYTVLKLAHDVPLTDQLEREGDCHILIRFRYLRTKFLLPRRSGYLYDILTRFNRKCVPEYSNIAAPLSDLTKKAVSILTTK